MSLNQSLGYSNKLLEYLKKTQYNDIWNVNITINRADQKLFIGLKFGETTLNYNKKKMCNQILKTNY